MIETMLTEHLDLLTTTHTTRSASGRGSGNKLELTGIKKLRELILELAVRGKLVPQNPEDEPASKLLERIEVEKAKLVKGKQIKKPKKLPDITVSEQPFELPTGWEWTRLGDITNYGTCDKAEPADVDTDTWVLELEDVEKVTSKLLQHIRFVDRQFKSSKNKFNAGDVIYGKLRPYLDKVLVADESGVCTTEMIPFRAYAAISPFYLRMVMKSPYFISYANASTHGMNLPRMGTDKARLALIPVVTESQQHRIVTKVDELMALCDQLEQEETDSIAAHQTLVDAMLTTLTDSKDASELAENWSLVAEHFDTLFTTEASINRLRQTILQLAVMGRLVPQNPDDEPAAKLLERIAAEKAQLVKEKKLKREKPVTPVTEDEQPFDLPYGWEWSRIANACLMTDYGLSVKTSKDTPGVPVLKMGDIQGSKVILGNQQTVPKSVEGLPELFLENRDILYNRTNSAELVGKTGLFIGSDHEYSFASYLIRIRTLKNTCLPEFINLNMATPLFRTTQINPYLKQQCGQANVNGTIMKNMLVAIAPESEQARVLQKYNELMSLCDTLQQQLQQAQTTQQKLASALVEQTLTPHHQTMSPQPQ